MRRVVGAVVLALGTFMVIAAILLPTYVASNLVTTPLDTYEISVATAEDATVFDVPTLKVETGVPVEATRTVRADVENSSEDIIVFEAFLVVEDTRTNKRITFNSDRVALDRRTGEAVKGYNANVDDEPTEHKGLQYKWPFNAEKKNYTYFDTTTKQPVTARYISSEEIGGLEVYKYQMRIEPTKIGETELPGSLLGSSEPDVKADRYYQNTRTIWVEPTTGIIIKGQEEQTQTYRDDTNVDKLTVFDATLTFDQETIDNNVKKANDSLSDIRALKVIAPLVLGVLGVILVIVGLVLAFKGGNRESDYTPASSSGNRTPVRS